MSGAAEPSSEAAAAPLRPRADRSAGLGPRSGGGGSWSGAAAGGARGGGGPERGGAGGAAGVRGGGPGAGGAQGGAAPERGFPAPPPPGADLCPGRSLRRRSPTRRRGRRDGRRGREPPRCEGSQPYCNRNTLELGVPKTKA
ncbi:hypothetical protein VULLAG_LOCUS12169 [Vulpes lagopus]